MSLLERFHKNLLNEFPKLKSIPCSGDTKKIAVVACSPLRKRENLQEIFSLLLGGRDVLLASEEQASTTGAYCWQKSREKHGWGRILLFTSGTSGNPRMVVHSLEELLKSAGITLDFYGVDKGDIWPLSLPLCHIGGLQIALRCLLAGISLEPLQEGGWDGASILSLVPTQWVRLSADSKNKAQLRKMKAILIGGAPLGGKFWSEAVWEKFPLSPTYGLTEMGSQVAALKPEEFLQGKKIGLQILPGRKAKIVNGKVVLSGVGQMLGFFERGRMVGERGEVVTADRGILREGRLGILGRADRIIISGGKKIEPEHLEFLLLEHPGIEEAVLLGLPDSFWGERLHLAYAGSPGLGVEDVRNFLNSRVASWEMPKGVSHHHFLPKKGGGKPDYEQIIQHLKTD